MISRAEKSLWDSLQLPEAISFWKAAGGWFLVTGAVLLLLWATGPVASTLFLQDTIGHVEAGNRVLHGHRLNVDFIASHWGPLYVWLVAVGIRLSDSASPVALHWAQGIFAVFLGLLLYLVALPRLRLVWSLLFLAAAELLLITATPLGDMTWREFGYAMYYNAICYVALAAFFLSILIPRQKPTTAGFCGDVFLEALALAVAFSVKAWFAVGAVVAYVLIRCLWPRPGEKRFWGLIGLVLFALLAMALSEPGGGWRPYLSLLTSDFGSDINTFLIPLRYIQFTHTWSAAGVAVLIALVFAHQCAAPFRRLLQLGLFSLVSMGAFLLGTSSSCQQLENIPFLGVVPLAAVLFAARTAQEKKATLSRLGLYCALLIAVMLLATEPKNCLLSRAFLHMTVKTFVPTKELPAGHRAPETDAEGLAALKYYNDPEYKDLVLEGMDLLHAAHVPHNEVLWICACEIAPFNHMVGNPPARGSIVTSLLWSIVPPERHPFLVPSFLEDTQWILKYKKNDYDWIGAMSRPDRKAYFESHFSRVNENALWILYHRTSP